MADEPGIGKTLTRQNSKGLAQGIALITDGLPLFTNCRQGVNVLKKSLSDRSVVPTQTQTLPKQVQNTYETRFSASEQGSEKSAWGFSTRWCVPGNSPHRRQQRGAEMYNPAPMTGRCVYRLLNASLDLPFSEPQELFASQYRVGQYTRAYQQGSCRPESGRPQP